MTSIALPPLSATMFHPHPLVSWSTVRSLSILFLLPLILCAWLLRSRLNRVKKRVPSFSTPDDNDKPRRKADLRSAAASEKPKETTELEHVDYFPRLERLAEDAPVEERERMVLDKELYWKMQNLEDHPDVVPQARTRLVTLLDQTLAEASATPADTILSIPTYSNDSLKQFLHANHTSATSRYEAYLARRKAGGPREMFPTYAYAKEWLRLAAVVKYVDGGWLGAVLDVATGVGSGKATSPGGPLERRAAKMAWQVISEEFGDGDLSKNHIYLYHRLCQSLQLGAIENGTSQPGHVRGFDGLRPDEGSPRAWAAAIAQQTIGLLAGTGNFFPEALGFNMAYECLPYHLLVTSMELRELKIDDYYFAIHVTIDNADSGHSAMARIAVERYLEGIRERDGEEAMEVMWKRVQAGFILAEGLPTTPSSPIAFEPSTTGGKKTFKPIPAAPAAPTLIEKRMAEIFMRKSPAAVKMHCPSRVLIKGQTIEQWLDPNTLTPERALEFLRGLEDKKPWVRAGDPDGSKLVQMLEWEGKMFGAFSREEVGVLRAWVKGLGRSNVAGAYEKHVGVVSKSDYTFESGPAGDADDTGIEARLRRRARRSLPSNLSFDQNALVDSWKIATTPCPQTLDILISPLPALDASRASSLLPLWYISTSLLEQYPLSSSKLASPLGMIVLRLIRSSLGFGALHQPEDICAGIDDMGHEDDGREMTGVWEITSRLYPSFNQTSPSNLAEVVDTIQDARIAGFAEELLELRTRPYANQAVLMGLTLGFADMYASSTWTDRLDAEDKTTLSRIVREHGETIREHVDAGGIDDWAGFAAGYMRVKGVLEGYVA